MDTNLAFMLQSAASKYEDAPAVSLGTKPKIDYRTLATQASQIAAELHRRGASPGDRIAMVMSNHIAFYPVLLGIWHAGMVAVPINAYESPQLAHRICTLAGARVCVLSPNLMNTHAPQLETIDGMSTIDVGSDEYRDIFGREPIDVVEPEGGADSLAWLMFTSGTSGPPKGVMLSHGAVARNCRRFLDEVESVEPGDALLHVTSMSHGGGLLGMAHILAGANQVIPKSGGLAPRELIKLIHHWPRPRMCLAPAVLRLLCEVFAGKSAVFDPLHAVFYGSAPMRQRDVRDGLAFFGPKLVQLYGLCEAPGSIACLSREDHERVARAPDELAPVGRVRKDVRLRILDDEGTEQEAGTIGHVHCATDALMSGYWGDPERTRAALDGPWLVTNDLGYVDDQGFLYLVGRRDDRPLDASGRVHPFVAEDRLSRHPHVRDCAVVEEPSSGELIAFASCVPGERFDDDEMRGLYASLDRAPVRHVQVGAIPYSTTGKVLRGVLQAEAARLDERWTEWQRFEIPPVQGLQLRLARTLDDARAIREMVREAWQLADEDRFFYHRFEEPEWVYTHLVERLGAVKTLEDLEAIALVAEEEGVVFGTASLVFDHTRKIVELGRGAIRPQWQGASRARRLALSINRFLEIAPHYNAVVDATIVHFGAGNTGEAINAVAVGLYPTSFVFQKGTAPQWRQVLAEYHGEEMVDAMIYLSPRTGMGRFATAYHMRLSPRTVPFVPILTASQQTLFEWTRDALKIRTFAGPQPVETRDAEVYDNPGTALRSVFVYETAFDLEACRASALDAGVETLILRIPCDSKHIKLSRQLDEMDAILGGVHPDARGHWTANYILPLGDDHYERTVKGLRLMAERAVPMAYAHLLTAVTGVKSDATTREVRRLPPPANFLEAFKKAGAASKTKE